MKKLASVIGMLAVLAAFSAAVRADGTGSPPPHDPHLSNPWTVLLAHLHGGKK